MSRCQSFEVGADGALALAALVDGHGGVVGDLEKGNDALTLAVGAGNVAAEGADRSPVVPEASAPLGEKGVVSDRAEDGVEVIRDGRQVAGRELWVARSGIEERWCGRAEAEGREYLIELDRPRLAVGLVQGKAHRDPHPEDLWQFDAATVGVDEVAIVERLDAEVAKVQVALWDQGIPEPRQVVLPEFGVDQILDLPRTRCRSRGRQSRNPAHPRPRPAGQGPRRKCRAERPGGDRRVDRVDLNPSPGGQDNRPVEVNERHPRVNGREDVVLKRLDGDPTLLLPLNRLGDPGAQQGAVNEEFLTGGIDNPQGMLVAAPGASLAVEDVAPGNRVRPGGHQLPLDFVLDLFNGGDGAAGPGGREGSQNGIGHGRDSVGNDSGQRIGEGSANLGPEGHLDRMVDPAPVERNFPPVALANACTGEIGKLLAGAISTVDCRNRVIGAFLYHPLLSPIAATFGKAQRHHSHAGNRVWGRGKGCQRRGGCLNREHRTATVQA